MVSERRSYSVAYSTRLPGGLVSRLLGAVYLGSVPLNFEQMVIYVYFLTSGASSPEWVKPTAEGGGICFRSIRFWFVICSFVICLFVLLFLFLFLST
jgi:hypothetical protein